MVGQSVWLIADLSNWWVGSTTPPAAAATTTTTTAATSSPITPVSMDGKVNTDGDHSTWDTIWKALEEAVAQGYAEELR